MDRLCVYAVATPYAWDVVESALRCRLQPWCLDNVGGADGRLPGLTRTGEPTEFVLGLSSGVHRAAAAVAAAAAGWDLPRSLVDPTAVVASTAVVGHGTYLNAGVVVGSHTTLGCHVNLNRSTSVGHDNTLGFAASLGPGAVTAGGVSVGAAALVGAGATVLPGVRIGRRAVVGAGAVVTRDVADNAVVVGNPARILRAVEPVEGDDRCPHC